MFKYATVIAVLAVSASLAVSVAASPAAQQQQQQQLQQQQQPKQLQPQQQQQQAEHEQEPIMAGTSIVAHKKHIKPEKIVLVAENEGPGLLESGLIALLEAISVPKKILGAVVGYAIGALKSLNVRKLVKTALVGALITVLGAVAAVSVAGLVSLVTGICAVFPYIRFIFGGARPQAAPESQLDTVSEFVLGALHKYDDKRKA